MTVTGTAQLTITAIAIVDSAGGTVCRLHVRPAGRIAASGGQHKHSERPACRHGVVPSYPAGTLTATLQVSHNQAGSPLVIQLSGMGKPVSLPLLSFSPVSLNFNPKEITNHTATLGNTGIAPLAIESTVIADPNCSMINTCNIGAGGGLLQPGQQCTVNVVCRFNGSGGSSDMVITHNATDCPAVL